jgi:hypothetical protein
MPSLILLAVYSAAFVLAIYYNSKKRYLINSIFSGTMITAYFGFLNCRN